MTASDADEAPWEGAQERQPRDPLEGLARRLLVGTGEDPDRDGLKEMPARFAR